MLKEVPESRQNARHLKRTFNRVLMSQVLEDIEITERIHVKASMLARSNFSFVFTRADNFFYKELFYVLDYFLCIYTIKIIIKYNLYHGKLVINLIIIMPCKRFRCILNILLFFINIFICGCIMVSQYNNILIV